MSHFSVLVITDEKPTQETLTPILQPWHEFECTGIDDEYVVDVDRTEEALQEFAEAKVTRLKAPDGSLHSFFDEKGEWRPEFSQVETDSIVPSRKRFIPAGYEEVEIPASQVEGAAQWISEYYGWQIAGVDDGEKAKYGFIELDAAGNVVRCVDRTNPNKKWDWWVIGGRWSGHLRLKEYATPELGRPGLLGSRSSDHRLATDIAMKRDVDVEAMRAEAMQRDAEIWDRANAAIEGLPAFEEFGVFKERCAGDWDAAREGYWGQPVLKALKEAFPSNFFLEKPIDAIKVSREAYLQEAADGALCTFAVVKDGNWYERGSMGWFGCVSDEKDGTAWSREFAKLIDDLPDTAFLTVVDCHI